MNRSLRIAILAHSTNPRGSVVHALAVADALVRMGHEAAVHAQVLSSQSLDASGRGLFRPSICRTVAIAASPVGASVRESVETRIADYVRPFEDSERRARHASDLVAPLSWDRSAGMHLPVYRQLQELQHA